MPLTFSHPAAVLPLMRGSLAPTALVAGSLAPDIPYFLRALRIPVTANAWWEPFLNATTTHHWPGMLTAGMPLALVLYLALTAATRPARWALQADMASPASQRMFGPRWLGWGLLSLALGLLTHVVWDALTDIDGWPARSLAVLGAHFALSAPWGRLLQHASTIVGLTVIALVAWRRRSTWFASWQAPHRPRFLRVLALVLVSAATAMVAVAGDRRQAGTGAERLLTNA